MFIYTIAQTEVTAHQVGCLVKRHVKEYVKHVVVNQDILDDGNLCRKNIA